MENLSGKIALTPSESIPEKLPAIIPEKIKLFFKKEVITLKPIKSPDYALDQIRFQYNAAKILKERENINTKYEKEILLLDVDLFIPIFTHVFGEAKLGGKKAVLSVFRLKDNDEKVFLNRTLKVILHETGHLYGLTHCREKDCLMQFSCDLNYLDSSDEIKFCEYCLLKLRNN